MKSFDVYFERTDSVCVSVKAKNKEDAKNKAEEELRNSFHIDEDFNVQDGYFEVYDVQISK
jgi:hypothetical protein